MTDSGSTSGRRVHASPCASSGRRSRARPFGGQPAPHDRPRSSRPSPDAGRGRRRPRHRRPRPSSVPRPPVQRERQRPRHRHAGYAPAARQRPGHVAGNGSGSACSRSNQVERRLLLPAVLDAFQVAVEEADELVDPVEVRARVGVVGKRVDPVADERPARALPHRSWIRNAASTYASFQPRDLEHRALERVVVGRQRAAAPVRAVGLLPDPRHEPRRRRLEPRRATRRATPRRGTAGAAASRSCPAG